MTSIAEVSGSTEPILLGMGNPLLDISAEVPTEVFEKYGLKPGDAALAEEKHQPLYNELVDNYDVEYIAGGATQNSMRVAQWILSAQNLAGRTAFIGCVGKDEFGTNLTKAASGAGVRVQYLEGEKQTGTCAVLIKDSERSLCANLSAANDYKIEHLLQPEQTKVVEAAKFYYIAGFFLTVSPDSMIHVGKHAAEQNKTFLMNLSAPFLCDFFHDQMMSVMPYVDYLFANETECAAFAKKMGWDDVSAEECALRASNLPKASSARKRIVVFTQGADATIVASDGKVTTFAVEKLESSKIIDTNGAGDAFVGGFLSQLVQGKPIEGCVAAGHYAAREIIQRSGCTYPDTVDVARLSPSA